MASRWRKAKAALGFNLCVYAPNAVADDGDEGGECTGRLSDATPSSVSGSWALMPMTPTPTSSGLKMSKSGSKSSKQQTCAICLGAMKAGQGHALFTAECSHIFHFQCIASNVKHGNRVCPICRAKWKEIPLQDPNNWTEDDSYMSLLRRVHQNNSSNSQLHHVGNVFHASEPICFDDDEPVDSQAEAVSNSQQGCMRTLEIKTFPEFPAIPKSASEDNFSVLVHLKAPRVGFRSPTLMRSLHSNSQTSRAPVDLVTLLDISGSMAGTKLALLKRAMGFVIQNLGPFDRLSVIAFSSTARRLFPLQRLSESGRKQALQAVNSLVSSGGTNIAEGLKKGAKVFDERKEKNPVCSIILLSDGQDTYTVLSSGGHNRRPQNPKFCSLVPSSVDGGIPVHAFGFGADHDSALLHTIAQISCGTFSFIETESAIQDAFAQCIGGLLSVVVQELRVNLECLHSGVCLETTIISGGYTSRVSDNRKTGFIEVGDLYADEERDFLVSLNIPAVPGDDTTLLKVSCGYKDPLSNESVYLEGEELRIQRPESVTQRTLSIEVDREKNRVTAVDSMAEARSAAERGMLSEAVSILETRRRILAESLAGRSGDRLCVALDAEIKEMQERMASRQRYEASGRAYVLSGLSSHSWQRATARGDSTDSDSLVQAYQTPSMADMVSRSQTLSPSSWQYRSLIRPTMSGR